MRFAPLFIAASLVISTPCMAQAGRSAGGREAAPTPVPIEEWPVAKVSAVGEKIYDFDTAAWLATDALRAAISEDELRTVRGWLVTPEGDGHVVHFYRQGDPDPVPGWKVFVKGRLPPTVTPAAETALTPQELAQARAVVTASANIGRLRCSRHMNSVIMRDPDGDEWLVWLLTPTPDDGRLPMGGHYRFRISADGGSVIRRDQLSNTCLFLDRPPADQRGAMLMTTQIVSRGPVETQVFLSIQNQLTIVVMAGDRYFSIGGARVSDITDLVSK